MQTWEREQQGCQPEGPHVLRTEGQCSFRFRLTQDTFGGDLGEGGQNLEEQASNPSLLLIYPQHHAWACLPSLLLLLGSAWQEAGAGGDGARVSPQNLSSFFRGSAFWQQLQLLLLKWARFQLLPVALAWLRSGSRAAQERRWLPAVAHLWVTLCLARLSAASPIP